MPNDREPTTGEERERARLVDYQRRIFRAMDHISRNLERELQLEEIAAAAAFSPFHFHRIFKAVVGENVAEFARRLRAEQAANRLLAYPRENVTSIALSCGFSSSQNFAKAFRQRYTMSPSQYRRSKKRPAEPGLPHASHAPVLEPARDVVIAEMPVSTAATIRRIGAYQTTCPAAFAELLSWARGKVLPGPGGLMAFYWDNPEVTPDDMCRFDSRAGSYLAACCI